jgi:hypothetical protein
MLEYVRDKVRDRKLRLFACACCRRMWHLLTHKNCRKAVEASELYADARIRQQSLAAACGAANKIADRFAFHRDTSQQPPDAPSPAALEAILAAAGVARSALLKVRRAEIMAHMASDSARRAATCARLSGSDEAEEWKHLVALVRHIFGNPFRPKAVTPAWRTATVLGVAQALYDERRFDRMPVLADALEDAGCDEAEVLAHCRQPGEHMPGCWALDQVLGKE